MNAVESKIDGKKVVVGMLCIPVHIRMDEFQYHFDPWGGWFEDLNDKTKAGFYIQGTNEVSDKDIPFHGIDIDLDKDYVFAMEYAVKKTVEKNKLIQVKTLDPYCGPGLGAIPRNFPTPKPVGRLPSDMGGPLE